MLKIKIKNFLIILIFLFGLVSYSQRPLTGQKNFKKQYPVEQINKLTNASLLVSNTLNEDNSHIKRWWKALYNSCLR